MGNMQVPLSLRPSQDRGGVPSSLINWVDRVWLERGHMRNITEESLKAEIDAENDGRSSSEDEDENEGEKPVDLDTKVKELFASRTSLLGLINHSCNEALTLLDCVSLLVSKDAPSSAIQTMSPALQQMTAPGTMAYGTTSGRQGDEAEELDVEKEAIAINFASLTSAADSLLKTATRLQSDLSKETRYWQEVLSISERGWSLSRFQGERHTIGVRIGCSEASPAFRAKALAALRPGDTGSLHLDSSSATAPKCLRVRIVDEEGIKEISTIPRTQDDDSPIEALVKQARDSVFDEELFNELVTEARNLLSSSVHVISDCITIPLDPLKSRQVGTLSHLEQSARKLIIDLVELDEDTHGDGDLAEAIALFLRLGLSHAHRERYARRTTRPPVLRNEKPRVAMLRLIESILCLIQHQSRVSSCLPWFELLATTLKSAGVPCQVDVESIFSTSNKSAMIKGKGKQPAVVDGKRPPIKQRFISIFSSSRGAQPTRITLTLPNSVEISLTVETSIHAPHYGTVYSIESSSASSKGLEPEPSSEDINEIKASRSVLVRDALLDYLAAGLPSCTLDSEDQMLVGKVGGRVKHLTVQVAQGKVALLVKFAASNERASILAAWQGDNFKSLSGETNMLALARKELDEEEEKKTEKEDTTPA